MDTGTKVVLVGGVADVAYGFFLGFALTAVRMRQADAPRHLLTTHLAAIMQGTFLIAASVALGVSVLPAAVETAAAALLVSGSVLFLAGTTMNWLQGVGDHFAARSPGWKLLAVSGPLNVAGILIVLGGVLRAL